MTETERDIEIKKYWNKVSDSEWYRSLRTEERLDRLRADPRSAFYPGVSGLIEKHLGGFSDKKILLPSSGDNHAAFAFALMGAKVTSSDISERQLENASAISERWGLGIEFVCDNTKRLSEFGDESFDLVYTSNGTLSWIDDPEEMYRNIRRVLKEGGLSAMFDVHPFTRPFTMEAWKKPEIRKSYNDVLPDLFDRRAPGNRAVRRIDLHSFRRLLERVDNGVPVGIFGVDVVEIICVFDFLGFEAFVGNFSL